MENLNVSGNSSSAPSGLGSEDSVYSVMHWIQFFMLLYGIITTCMVLTIFIYYRNSTPFNSSFFTVATGISIGDLSYQLLNIIDIFFRVKYYSVYSVLPRIFGFPTTWIWYSIVWYQMLIAIDRFIATNFPHSYKLLVTNKNVVLSMVIVNVFAFCMTAPMITVKYGFFYYPGGVIGFNFLDPQVVMYSRIRDFGMQPFIFVTVISLYIASSIAVYRQGQRVHSDVERRTLSIETRLMVQGMLVTMPMIVVVIFYHIFLYGQTSIKPSHLNVIVTLSSTFSIVVFIINPTIYTVFSKDVRSHLAKFFLGRTIAVNPSGNIPMATLHTTNSHGHHGAWHNK